MKKISTFLFLAVLLVWQNYANAANATVTVGPGGANTFSPAQVTINAGEMVTWQWASGIHSIKSDSSPEQWSEVASTAAIPSFSHVFNTAGSYPYHCTVHGLAMAGTVVVLAGPTGMKDDQLKKALLQVYPNPAQNKVKVALNVADPGNYELRFTNAIGKTVKTVSAAELKAVKETEIDLSAMSAGIYFYTLWRNDEMVETRRLVISK